MKEKYFIHTVLLYLLLGSPTVHSKDIGSREEFISYMEEKHGFDYKQLNLLFDKTVISKSILDAIQRPAEKKFLWYQYRKIFIKEKIRNELKEVGIDLVDKANGVTDWVYR